MHPYTHIKHTYRDAQINKCDMEMILLVKAYIYCDILNKAILDLNTLSFMSLYVCIYKVFVFLLTITLKPNRSPIPFIVYDAETEGRTDVYLKRFQDNKHVTKNR